jgi:hypothetical protein
MLASVSYTLINLTDGPILKAIEFMPIGFNYELISTPVRLNLSHLAQSDRAIHLIIMLIACVITLICVEVTFIDECHV